MKKTTSILLSIALLAPALMSFGGCASKKDVTLRVYNWEEYIDDGGEGCYDEDFAEKGEAYDDRPIIDKFEEWYEKTYRKSVHVEYSTFGTNEDLYNQLKLGDQYDLVCPSEYMIMKLAAEGMLTPLPASFFDEEDEHNYYINNVSPYIKQTFDNGKMKVLGEKDLVPWRDYAAGYMWGVTGLVYNPELVAEEDLEQGWSIMLDEHYKNKVTTKDNVRDSYFVGLAIAYRDELLSLKEQHENQELTDKEYNAAVTAIMNRVDEKSVEDVTGILKAVGENIFNFETDTGKSDMITGKISINFAWSGDAVYAMDEAESQEKNPVSLNFYVPKECANLYFDGWVMPKDDKRSEQTQHAALAFINFMSRPDNAIRNSYYIGYTSVIAGEEMFEYAKDVYESEDEDDAVPYDVGYFFRREGDNNEYIIKAPAEQLNRQLAAQFPLLEVVNRCAVMDYYGDAEEAINELWTQVRGAQLSGWAIAIIVVAAAVIVLGVLYKFLGSKIEFRLKPKKGYKLVKQEKVK